MREAFLDTDILSEVLKRRDPRLLSYAVAYLRRYGRFIFSADTVHEVVHGLESKSAVRQLADARRAFAQNEVVLPTIEDFERAAVVRGQARRRGRGLSFPDCLIGAAAERLGLPVATGNVAHFQAMVDAGLAIELENWRDPGLSA